MSGEKVYSKEAVAEDRPFTQEGETIDIDEVKYGHTKRGLSSRHVQLMAIGGSIGTGLFVGIGGSLSKGGPLSLFLAYLIYPTLLVLPCCMCVAEMATFLPVRDCIFRMANRFMDPAFCFAFGWTWFYGSFVLVCAELSAVAAVMGYWNIDVNAAVWVVMGLAVLIIINILAVKYYGEAEFFFAILKVILLIGLVMLTFITMVGGNPKHDAYGFRYWKHGNAMHEYYTTGSTGRFLGFFRCMRYAAFSIGGPEMIALTAGEVINPRRTIPSMARLVWIRVVGFYLIGSLAVGIICYSRDTRLLGALSAGTTGSAASPFVIGIKNLGITGLDSLVNVLILSSGWSCGNAYFYTSTRTLYQLALEGQAPKIFLKCTKNGVPIVAVAVISVAACLTFLVASNSSAVVFGWFVDLSTCAALLSYSMMMMIWVQFNKAMNKQGISRTTLPWMAPFMPYHAYIGIGTGAVLVLFLGFDVFVPWSTQGFVTTYFGIPYVLSLYAFWKIFKKTKMVNLAEIDIFAGKEEVDRELEQWDIEHAEKMAGNEPNFLKKLWVKMWEQSPV